MFGGMSDFDLDPASFRDIRDHGVPSTKGTYGRSQWDNLGSLADLPKAEVVDPDTGEPISSGFGAKVAEFGKGVTPGGVKTLFESVAGAVGTAQAQKQTAYLDQLRALQAKQAQQRAAYQAKMQQYGPTQFLPSLTSKYGVLLIVGVITLIGGLVLLSRRKR